MSNHANHPGSESGDPDSTPSRRARWLLAIAAIAVAFAAADTYVVVLALPDMMTSVGIEVVQLQRAAPIISGFLLGYVAILPLIGRIADLRGRLPVLGAALVVFAFGSLITALSYDLTTMVVGRFLQGVGGGGLVPATLALVADLYPVRRRAVPLGVVSAVQEIGSVIGPLFGAAIIAIADWRAIFAVNLLVGGLLAALVWTLGRESSAPATTTGFRGWRRGGLGFLALTLLCGAVVFLEPPPLVSDLTWGQLFIPTIGSSRWLTPLGLITIVAALLFLARCLTASRPIIDLGGWWRTVREADLPGALLLAAVLSGVILAFATADPKIQVFSEQGLWYLLGGAVALVWLIWHLRRTDSPIIPAGAIRARQAWGALIVSFFVGAALIAALIDIPLFARTTVHSDSQLLAALVLVRFLIALPIGAVVGGYLTSRFSAGWVAAVGMVLAAVGFVAMSRWGLESLESATSTIPLVVGGFGFGLALAPVNAVILATTKHEVHGLASALVVVARMVGMLVGISALTTLGLRSYYAEQADIPAAREVCGGKSRCTEFTELLKQAGIAQEHTVFLGAAGCALVAALLALVLFQGAATRGLSAAEVMRSGG